MKVYRLLAAGMGTIGLVMACNDFTGPTTSAAPNGPAHSNLPGFHGLRTCGGRICATHSARSAGEPSGLLGAPFRLG